MAKVRIYVITFKYPLQQMFPRTLYLWPILLHNGCYDIRVASFSAGLLCSHLPQECMFVFLPSSVRNKIYDTALPSLVKSDLLVFF